MANQPPTRYKTDKRLWFLISLLLFAVPWFISKADCMRGNFKPASLFLELRNPPVTTSNTLQLIGGFALSFAIRALAYGWVLHCLVVVIREKRRKKTHAEDRSAADVSAKTTSTAGKVIQ